MKHISSEAILIIFLIVATLIIGYTVYENQNTAEAGLADEGSICIYIVETRNGPRTFEGLCPPPQKPRGCYIYDPDIGNFKWIPCPF